MPRITCEAKKCFYNADGLCSKDSVKIEGSATTASSSSTFCESYAKESGCAGGACNVTSSVKGLNDIECDATSCVYNKSNKCTASGINVSGATAEKCESTSCETFKKA